MHHIYRIIILCVGGGAAWAMAAPAENVQNSTAMPMASKRVEIREVVKEELKNPQIRSKVKHLSASERQELRQQIRVYQTTPKAKAQPTRQP